MSLNLCAHDHEGPCPAPCEDWLYGCPHEKPCTSERDCDALRREDAEPWGEDR